MSYCVNCGVKLHPTAEICDLCQTKVINPNHQEDASIPTPYVQQNLLERKDKHVFGSVIIGIVLVTINLLCLVSNLLYSNGIFWFVIVLAATGVIAVAVLMPLLCSNFRWRVYIPSLTAAAALLMFSIGFVIETYTWVFKLALPILILIDVCLFLGLLLKSFLKPGILPMISLSLFVLSISSIGCDFFIQYYLYNRFRLSWSIIVAICCISISLILYLITYNTRWRLALQKFFHI